MNAKLYSVWFCKMMHPWWKHWIGPTNMIFTWLAFEDLGYGQHEELEGEWNFGLLGGEVGQRLCLG